MEVEMKLNRRSLSYMSGEYTKEPLTLLHLLRGWGLMSLPDSNTSDTPDYADVCSTSATFWTTFGKDGEMSSS